VAGINNSRDFHEGCAGLWMRHVALARSLHLVSARSAVKLTCLWSDKDVVNECSSTTKMRLDFMKRNACDFAPSDFHLFGCISQLLTRHWFVHWDIPSSGATTG
jgi:hypothetical protein